MAEEARVALRRGPLRRGRVGGVPRPLGALSCLVLLGGPARDCLGEEEDDGDDDVGLVFEDSDDATPLNYALIEDAPTTGPT